MTFNPNARIDPSRVRRRRGGAAAGGVTLAGGLGIVALLLLSNWIGIDLTGLAGAFDGSSRSSVGQAEESLDECRTGADANANIDCRIAGAADSLDEYWAGVFAQEGLEYRTVRGLYLFSGATGTACGTGQSGMGPFYCPGDESIYMDTAFFASLASQARAEIGPLAQMYVVAHEWGHHIQHISGIMSPELDLRDTGPESDSVRLELQADCFAGSWVAAASSTTDASGVPLLVAPTRGEVEDALGAAKIVGDDFIQREMGGGYVNPEAWTHGSSESRMRWFTTGYEQGAGACETFGVPVSEL